MFSHIKMQCSSSNAWLHSRFYALAEAEWVQLKICHGVVGVMMQAAPMAKSTSAWCFLVQSASPCFFRVLAPFICRFSAY